MKKIKNLRELDLMKVNLQYQELNHKKAITESSAKIVDNVTGTLRNLAFDVGTAIAIRLISGFTKRKKTDSAH